MSRFGLIGNPISHSKSPSLFKAAYGNSHHTYSLFETQTVTEAIDLFEREDIAGVNVTSPFKDEVMDFVTLPDRISSILGSANVLIKGEKEGEILSYNTDYYGVRRSVEALLDGPKYKGKVAVIGAGGAGKAAALAMRDMGFEVTILNRSSGKVKEFAGKIGTLYLPLEKLSDSISDSDIIIYALSFLLPGVESMDFRGKIIFEANYLSPSLSWVDNVESATYIDGRYWLYNQAIPAFELFTGEEPNTLEMRKVMGIE